MKVKKGQKGELYQRFLAFYPVVCYTGRRPAGVRR